MIDTMGAVRRLVRARLTGLVVCAGGLLLAAPAVGLAAGWSPTTETVGGGSGATEVASSFDASTNLIAIWPGASAVESAVRTASWPGGATSIGGASGATSPALAIGSGTSLAAWIDSGSLSVSMRSGVGGWSAAESIASTGVASSPQAAIVGGNPTVFWLDGGAVESATLSGGLWSAEAAPTGAPAGPISGLRMSIDSTGSGVAAWVDGANVDTAVITTGTWAVNAGSLSTSAGPSTTVAVAAQGSIQAVAWSEPTNGVQVAVSTGSGLVVEPAAKDASASHPALGFDSTGRLFAAYLSGSTVTAEIRDTTTGWGSEATVGTGAGVAPSVAGDGSGDAAVTWVGVSALQMRSFDATKSDVTINPPADLSPGTHTWSVTTSDLWSKSGGSTSWSFSDTGTATGDSVSHADLTPGPVTATATRDDGVGNITIVSKTVTIAPVAPTNSSPPAISAGGSLVSGTKLTGEPGTWSGNPAPSLTEEWQRCDSSTCTAIPNATASNYTLTAADVGFKIRLEETASNSGGSAFADSVKTAVVGPVATGQPTLTPSASPIADGVTLTASASQWGGAANLSFTYRFQRCDGTCPTVQESASNTYTLGPADVGSTIQVSVVAQAGPVDGDLSVTATSTSAQTVPVAPESTSAPTLSGATQDTQLLTASSPNSSWDGATGLIKTYVFSRCDTSGANCSQAQSGSSATYTLTASDLGETMIVVAKASSNGSAVISSSQSAKTAVVTPWANPPAPGVPSGLTKDGAGLTAPTVNWADPGSLTPSWQWIACSAATGCDPISGATSSSYFLQASDVGMTIQVVITATANGASTSLTSGSTAPVQPLNDGAASVTPSAQVQDGQNFAATNGSWHGATGLAFTYVWKRCDSTGAACQAISGATSQTYTAGAPDTGQTLRVKVSASKNGSASTGSSDSTQTAVIAPLSTGTPGLSGAAQDGQLLTASSPAADWDGVPSLTQTYQFYRCDETGVACVAVDAASSSPSYSLSWDDIGSTIRVVALASKNGSIASSSGSSTATSIIRPTLTAAPAAPTGAAQDGQQLTAATGAWLNQAHLSFKYQYFRCSPSCTSLGPQSDSATYVLQPGDVGNTIQVGVTAYIGAGTTLATSSNTLAIAPLNTGVSSITAPAQQQDGQTYTASDGAWDGATGLAIGYQWKRCDSSGNSCSAIQGATSKTYTSGPNDVGQTLRAIVSASKGGSAKTLATGDSAQTGVVAPRNTVLPTTSGTPMDGQVLTAGAAGASAGSWDGVANLTYAYQWLRCDGSGNACAAITTNGTGSTYTLTPDDVAAPGDATHARITIRVQISATINGASTAANSNATPPIAAAPTVNTTLPAVSGDPIENQELTASSGAWSGTDVHVVSYQWVRCDPPFATCTNDGIASLSGRYIVQTADVGHYVTFVETVANRLGATSTQRAAVGKPVVSNVLGATDAPVVTPPTYVDGTVLATSDGVWLPSDHLTFTYQWLRCPGTIDTTADDSSSCPWILSATSSTYTLTPADIGSYVVALVKATYTQDGIEVTHAVQPSSLEGLPLVTARPPANSTRPTITGAATQDVTLTASPGVWSGTNTAAVPITFAYQWLRCDTSGGACVAVSGATKSTFAPSAVDVGSRLAVRVTATNSGGSASASSDATGAVAGLSAASTSGGGQLTTGTPTGGSNGASGGGAHLASVKSDKTKPVLTIALVGGGALAGGTTLSVYATCPKTETSCTAVFHLLAKLKRPTGKALSKPVTISSARATLASGQKKLLKLKLSSAARSALRKTLKLKVTLTASVTDAAGNVTPNETKGFTLRWKKP
jgi:hypothetical protein